MITDFAFYLTIVVFLTSVISVADWLVFKKRRSLKTKTNFLVECAKVFSCVVDCLDSSVFYNSALSCATTDSLESMIMPGDFIAVEQFAYGLRLSVINKEILLLGAPK